MATYQILYWQEIPSLVEARDQNGVKKIQLVIEIFEYAFNHSH